MVKVKNGGTLRELAFQFLKANKKRNLLAVCAIVLTSLLFTSLFTGVTSMILSKRQADMKSHMFYSHSVIQQINGEDLEKGVEAAKKADFVEAYGVNFFLGLIYDSRLAFTGEVRSADETAAQAFNGLPTEGHLPGEKQEIAMSSVVLDTLGIPRELGEELTLTLSLDFPGGSGEKVTDTFVLSGWWEGDRSEKAQFIWVSEEYREELVNRFSEEGAKETEDGSWSINVYYTSDWKVEKDTARLNELSGLSDAGRNQSGFTFNSAFILTGEGAAMRPGSLVGLVFLIMLAGYLIIYNIFSISVKNDIRVYGLLKNVGTTGKQLKKIVRIQAFSLCLAGIPLGLLAGYGVGLLLSPALNSNLSSSGTEIQTITSANPLIFAASAVFALLTVYLSSLESCWMVEKVSPVEALKIAEDCGTKKKTRRNSKISWWGMAVGNMRRNLRKGMIVMLSIALSLYVLNRVAVIIGRMDFERYSYGYVSGDFQLDKCGSTGDFADYQGITPEIKEILEACPYAEQVSYVHFMETTHEMEPELFKAWTERAERISDFEEAYQAAWEETWAEEKESGEIRVDLMGINEGAFEKLEWREEPHTWEEFQSGDYVIALWSEFWAVYEGSGRQGSNYQSGDTYVMEYPDGTRKEYTVLGEAEFPATFGFPFANLFSVEILVPEEEFIAHTGIDSAMRAGLDAKEGQQEEAFEYLNEQLLSKDSLLNLRSVLEVWDSFENILMRYYLVGGGLALILAVIGVMNFYNTSATSALSRKREFALLEAVGMTKRQLMRMLTAEGGIYLGGGILFAILLSCGDAWLYYFRYGTEKSVNILPSILLLPVFLLIAWLVSRSQFKKMSRESVVERIRQE